MSANGTVPEPADLDISTLVPHAPPVLALDRIDHVDESSLSARVTIREDSIFCEPGVGVPVWVALEFFGQAVAALEGVRARDSARPVPVGYLLGTRRFLTPIQAFPVGARLQLSVRELHADPTGLALFHGAIEGEEIAIECRFSVYRKADGEQDGHD